MHIGINAGKIITEELHKKKYRTTLNGNDNNFESYRIGGWGGWGGTGLRNHCYLL